MYKIYTASIMVGICSSCWRGCLQLLCRPFRPYDSPLITAPTDSSHSSLLTVPAVWELRSLLWTATAAGAVIGNRSC